MEYKLRFGEFLNSTGFLKEQFLFEVKLEKPWISFNIMIESNFG